MGCHGCQERKMARYNELLNKVRESATAYAKAKKLKEIIIIETANGIPGYREPGDESIARLRILDRIYTG